SEEHTSELQSLTNIVCRLLLEKKNNITSSDTITEKHRINTIHQVPNLPCSPHVTSRDNRIKNDSESRKRYAPRHTSTTPRLDDVATSCTSVSVHHLPPPFRPIASTRDLNGNSVLCSVKRHTPTTSRSPVSSHGVFLDFFFFLNRRSPPDFYPLPLPTPLPI